MGTQRREDDARSKFMIKKREARKWLFSHVPSSYKGSILSSVAKLTSRMIRRNSCM